jgi:hypothetical protein
MTAPLLDARVITIYGYHMSKGKEKTTVYLDRAEHRRLKALAAAAERPTAELIREAVAEYVRRHEGRARPASVGAARSGGADLSERSEELLRGFGEA